MKKLLVGLLAVLSMSTWAQEQVSYELTQPDNVRQVQKSDSVKKEKKTLDLSGYSERDYNNQVITQTIEVGKTWYTPYEIRTAVGVSESRQEDQKYRFITINLSKPIYSDGRFKVGIHGGVRTMKYFLPGDRGLRLGLEANYRLTDTVSLVVIDSYRVVGKMADKDYSDATKNVVIAGLRVKF